VESPEMEATMDNTLLRRLLIDEEGYNSKAHRVKGVWHIGIGHNLEIEQTEEELAILGNYTLDDVHTLLLTEQECYDLFDLDVQDALDDVQPTFMPDELDALGETRRAVILSMVFQCGGRGFRAFKKFIAAVKAGDFATAAIEMLDSKAGREDSPERFQRASFAMRHGYFKEYANAPVEPVTNIPILANVPDDAFIAELTRRLKKK